MVKQTKAETEKVQDDIKEEVTPPEPTTPEPPKEEVVTPETAKGKGETNWEQKYKTLEGMHRQSTDELKTLKQEKLNYSEISTAINQVNQIVTQQGETLTLITDILSENAVDNEDLQKKIKLAKQKSEEDIKKTKAYQEIMAIASQADLKPDSPELEPVRQAFTKGDLDGAKTLTFVTVLGKVKEGKIVKEPEKPPEPEKPKKTVPVITSTTGHPVDWRDLSPSAKIKQGLEERKND